MHTNYFFRISCVVTSSAYASFQALFNISFQILMFSNHVFLNLRHKLREDLSEWCAKMARNLNTIRKL